MKFIRCIHAAYSMLIFGVLFFTFFPLFLIPIIFPKRHQWTGRINRWWAHAFFTLIFIPYEIEYRFTPEKDKSYIFCPNHFSYMDIPTMGLNKVNSIFVGKNDMEKVPIFGYMYKKLHITVNRSSLKSRYATIVASGNAIDEGKNLTIFPEGGIITEAPPQMTRFKDGAFRVAIDKQIDIIPVTIAYNWIILRDGTLLPKRHKMKVIYHEPISTKGLTLEDIRTVKEQTFEVIDNELKLSNA